jgi:hypothetical protein
LIGILEGYQNRYTFTRACIVDSVIFNSCLDNKRDNPFASLRLETIKKLLTHETYQLVSNGSSNVKNANHTFIKIVHTVNVKKIIPFVLT